MDTVTRRKTVDSNTDKIIEEFLLNERYLHNPEGPARIVYYKNGEVCSKEWYLNGYLQRKDDLPCKIQYYRNGRIKEKIWFKNNKIHRVSKPAIEQYTDTGNITFCEWMRYDKPHNLFGPAIKFFQNNKPIQERYYIFGKYIGPEHPFYVYKKNNNLSSDYCEWPVEYKCLYNLKIEHLCDIS